MIRRTVLQFTYWLFHEEAPSDAADIMAWWESRRPAYNLFVFCLMVISLPLFLFFIYGCNVLEAGEDAFEPIALLFSPILINICYTAGWIVEVAVFLLNRKRVYRCGPALLKWGLGFSTIIIFLPTVMWGISWVSKMLTGK